MRYVVRLGFMERCYVERDYIIEADTPRQAETFALDRESIVDAGPDHCCIPEGMEDLKIVAGAKPATE
ncbi:MAG: hypothetical protein ACREFP_11390 [Acetobacteraceae bacterium]